MPIITLPRVKYLVPSFAMCCSVQSIASGQEGDGQGSRSLYRLVLLGYGQGVQRHHPSHPQREVNQFD
jgi:hypothetical protein